MGLAAKFTMLAGVAGIAAVGLAAKSAISTFTDFEAAIANAASVTGATGEVFEETKKHIEAVSRELGETTVFSASQAANAFYDLASAGYDVANMTKDELQPILELAAATQNDLTKTTEAVTSTLGQFGLGMESSGRVADVFTAAIGGSKAKIGALETSLSYVGPVANSMGVSIEDTVAILGQLYNAGYDGSKAGNMLRSAFATLLNPVGQAAEVIEEFSLDIERLNPETNDFADILDYLSESGFGTTEMFRLFGQEAAPAMAALIEKTDGIRELGDVLENSAGAAATMAGQQLDTLSGSFALLKSALEGVSITLGKALAPYIKLLAEYLTSIIPVLMNIGAEIKERLQPAFDGLAAFFKELIPKVVELSDHFIKKLQPAFKSVDKITKSLGKIFNSLTSDIGSNEAAFTTLTSVLNVVVDVLNALAKFWEIILGFFAEHPQITKFAIIITAAIVAITTPILAIIAALALLAVAWDKDWLGIKTTTLKVVDAISFAIGWFVDAATTAIQVFLALLKGDWEGAWDAIKTYIIEWGPIVVTAVKNIGKAIIEGLIHGIKAALGALWDIITGEESITSTIVGGLKSIIPKAKSEGKEVSDGVADGIQSGVSAVSAATGTVTDTIEKELETAPPDAQQTGLSTSLAMADGIKSGASAVSSAARAVVDAATAEMDRLWAQQQADKSSRQAAEERAASKGANVPEGALDIVGQIITSLTTTKYGWERAHVQQTGQIGTGKKLTDTYEGDIEAITGKYYITESVWKKLSEEQQKAMADNIIDVISDDWKISEKVGREGSSNLYKRFIKESAFWTEDERSLANLQAEIDGITAEIAHLEKLGVDPDQSLINKLDELCQALESNIGGGGGLILPTSSEPVLIGGNDIAVNVTYNIDRVDGVSDIKKLLREHDEELSQRLQELV